MSAPLYSSNAPIFDPEGVDVGELAKAKAEADAAKGAAVATPTGNVIAMVNPQGQTVGIDEADMPKALAQGYRPESKKEALTRKYVAETEAKFGGGALETGIDHFLDAATFGIYDPLSHALVDETEASAAAHEQVAAKHKTAGYLGEGLGFGASLLYGGEFFKGAEAAGAGVKASIAGAGSGLGRRIAGSVAGSAVEGGIFVAPKAAAEFLAGDPDKAGETLLYGLGAGSVLGLAGPTASAIKKGATAGYDYLGQKIGGAGGVKAAIGDMADMQAYRSLASSREALGKSMKTAEFVGGPKAIGREVAESGLIRQPGEALDAYAKRFADATSGAGQDVGAVYTKLDAATGGPVFSIKKIVQRADDQVIKPLLEMPGMKGVASGVKEYLDDFASIAAADGREALTFEELHKFQMDLKGLVKFESGAKVSDRVAQLREIRYIYKDELQKAAEEVSPELAAELKKVNARYGRLSSAKAAVDHNLISDAKLRVLSPSDNGWGIAGGVVGSMLTGSPLGALAGGAAAVGHRMIRTEGNGILARGLYGLESRMNGGLEVAAESVIGRLNEVPALLTAMGSGEAKAGAAKALGVHALTEFTGASAKGKAENFENFKTMADQLTSLSSDPARMQATLAEMVGPFAQEHPDEAAALARKSATALDYLVKALPKDPAPPNPFVKSQWKPSDAQLAEYGKRVETTLEPFSVFRKLADRTLSKPDVETLHAVYPKLYEAIVQKVAEFGASGKAKELPYQYRLKLSQLLGVPMDRSITNMAAYQMAFTGDKPNKGKPGGGGGAGGAPMHAPQVGTDIQRVSNT